jgi:hypothetical protein
VVGSCEHGNETSVAIKGEEYFEQLRKYACRKRRPKWVATLPLGDINTEAWSSGIAVGRGANNPTL